MLKVPCSVLICAYRHSGSKEARERLAVEHLGFLGMIGTVLYENERSMFRGWG